MQRRMDVGTHMYMYMAVRVDLYTHTVRERRTRKHTDAYDDSVFTPLSLPTAWERGYTKYIKIYTSAHKCIVTVFFNNYRSGSVDFLYHKKA